MNGITASLILNGDSASQEDIDSIENEMDLMFTAYGPEVEIVLYFSKRPELRTRNKNIVLASSKTIPPFQKAVVVASGETLVFTTLRNFLVDTKNYALNQALDLKPKTVAVPGSIEGIKKLGYIWMPKMPYVLARKEFILKFLSKTHGLSDMADYARKKHSLTQVPLVDFKYPESIYRGHILSNKKDFGKDKHTQKIVEFNKKIPLFIICRDRLQSVKDLVDWCEKEGLENIIFIDNDSSYPPLLEYYSKTPYEVIRLNHNVGYLSPWMIGAVQVYAKDKDYIVSDSDVVPLESAHGAVSLFCHLLNKYPKYVKAGFGLKIDDIPDSYEPKDNVISWENKFWQKEVEKEVYEADIDTTFALWRKNSPHVYGPSLRTGGKYVARHTTWYIDSNNIPAEARYYRDHVDKVVNTWGVEKNELPKLYTDQKLDMPKKKKMN